MNVVKMTRVVFLLVALLRCPDDRAPPTPLPDCVDVDRDGYGFGAGCAGSRDCDDRDDRTFPGAPEACDGRDNDCDPRTEPDRGCAQTDAGVDIAVFVLEGGTIEDVSNVSDDTTPDLPLEDLRLPPAGDVTDAGPLDVLVDSPNDHGEVTVAADVRDVPAESRADAPVSIDAGCSSGCDDGNPCTEDLCEAGACAHRAGRDGVTCGSQVTCSSGRCVCPVGAPLGATFSVARPASSSVDSTELLDIDGDGDLDYLTHNTANDHRVAWQCFSNDGRGNFRTEPGWLPAGIGDHDVQHIQRIALDDDRRDDFVAAVTSPTSFTEIGLEFYRNTFTGADRVSIFRLTARFARMTSSSEPTYCWGDLEGDGRLDFFFNDQTSRRMRQVTLDRALGALSERTDSPMQDILARNYLACAAGDIDGDGAMDFALVEIDAVRVFRQVAGRFVAAGSPGSRCSTRRFRYREMPRLVDLNGDRRADFLCQNELMLGSAVPFGFAGQLDVPFNCDDASGVLARTCNGRPNLACAYDYQRLAWNYPDRLQNIELRPRESARQIAVGDVNGDGLDDFIALSDGTSSGYTARVYLAPARLP